MQKDTEREGKRPNPSSLQLTAYIQSISPVLLHSELQEGSGLHPSFLNNAVFWGGKPEPSKVLQSSEQQTHSSQCGSLDKSYAYSNMAPAVSAAALQSCGCLIKCQLCCVADGGRISPGGAKET